MFFLIKVKIYMYKLMNRFSQPLNSISSTILIFLSLYLRIIMLRFGVFVLAFFLAHGVFAADDEEAAEGAPSYVPLGDSMVLNLSTTKKRLTFLQLKVDVLVEDAEAEAAVTTHIPAIRHQIIVLLSEQNAMDMKSPIKRNDIRKLATDQVKEVMDELSSDDGIEDVLFSSFLIQ